MCWCLGHYLLHTGFSPPFPPVLPLALVSTCDSEEITKDLLWNQLRKQESVVEVSLLSFGAAGKSEFVRKKRAAKSTAL